MYISNSMFYVHEETGDSYVDVILIAIGIVTTCTRTLSTVLHIGIGLVPSSFLLG